MRALVTGSNGFIGSYLVDALLAQGHQPRCLVRKTSNLKWLQSLAIDFAYGDLSAPDSLAAAVQEVDWVFHLAGLTRAQNREEFFRVNYHGVFNLLTACEQFNPGLKKFIFISSQAAAGPANSEIPRTELDPPNPLSAYGEAKLTAENAVLKAGEKFPVTIIRPPSVYGPRDTEVLIFFKLAKLGIRPVIAGGQNRLSLVYVDDLVTGILTAAESDNANGKVFYIAESTAYTWTEILKTIAVAVGNRTIPLFLPLRLVQAAGAVNRLMAKVFKVRPLLSKDKVTEIKQRYWLCDTRRASDELGFNAKIPLAEGIKRTARWYKEQGWL